MRKAITLIVILVLALAGGYYYYGYAPEVLKRRTQQALNEFCAAMTAQDRSRVGANLKALLKDTAKIHLDVRFVSFSEPQGSAPQGEDFTKPIFITFIDNVIYSLQNYGMDAQLTGFDLSRDKASATIAFTSATWGEDIPSAYRDMHMGMRFRADSICRGHIAFSGSVPMLTDMECAIEVRTRPLMEEDKQKTRLPEALQRMLP